MTLWLKFEQTYKDYFFLINTAAEAMKKLEETSYYQESHAVEDYLDEFQTLISKTSYTDL